MSILPKIDLPKITVTLPYTGVEASIRPYTVREEKILLMAMESITEDMQTDEVNKIVFDAVNQILELTVEFESSETKVADLPFFETEYLFVKARSISDNNALDIIFTRNIEDENGNIKKEEINVSFDLNETVIDFDSVADISGVVKLTENVSVKLRYPNYVEHELMKQDIVKNFNITDFIVSVTSDTTSVKRSDIPEQELTEFFESLPIMLKRKLEKFFEVMPQVHMEKEIKLNETETTKVELNGLNDFFA